MENEDASQDSLPSTEEGRLTGAYPTNTECDFLLSTRRHLGTALHGLRTG